MIEIKDRRTGKVIKTIDADKLMGVDLLKADLRNADLNGANLNGANLKHVNLSHADLFGALLIRANLAEADLSGADLSHADLRFADLHNANLYHADLSHANLSHANLKTCDLTRAVLIATNLNRVDLDASNLTEAALAFTTFTFCQHLHEAKGLETIDHEYSSALDEDTLRQSIEHLPDVFLRGVGYNDEEIETLRGLYGKAFRFYSCFISYARADDEFASRFYSDLQANNVTCWKDTENIKGGDYWQSQIYEAIRIRDKVILVCSERSLTRPAVIEEILKAIEREKDGPKKLFPIRLDDFIFSDELAKIGKEQTAAGEWPANWLAKVRAYHIPDFSGWEDHKRYKLAFDKLLRDLKGPAKP